MKHLALALGACVTLLGCGGGSGSVIGSCSDSANGTTICIDWEKAPTGVGASNLEQTCQGGNKMWSASACTATGRTGRCRITSGSGATETVYVTNYYEPVTATDVQTACTAAGTNGAATQYIP